MKKFRFHLAGLEMLREAEESAALETYREALRSRLESERVLEDAQRQQLLLQASMRERLAVRAPAAQHASWLGWSGHAGTLIADLEQKVAQRRTYEESKLSAYLEAKRQLELVRELKKRNWQSHRLEVERREQQAAEDIYNGARHAKEVWAVLEGGF